MINSADRPRWIPIREMVPEGTFGAKLISEIPNLGVRLRPETTFHKPLQCLSRKDSLAILAEKHSATVEDILKLPVEDLTPFRLVPELRDTLSNYLKGLFLLPHSRLLAAVYVKPQFPVPVEREQEVVKGVEDILSMINSKEVFSVFILRFGLYDGITRTLEETGKKLEEPVIRERVRQIAAKGFRQLKQPTYGAKRYLVLPEASFGREVFKAVLMKDLPDLGEKETIYKLNLYASTFEELRIKTFSSYYTTIEDLVTADLGNINGGQISVQTMDDITQALCERVTEVANRFRRERRARAYAKVLIEEERKRRDQELAEKLSQLKNNLFPEIPLDLKQIGRLHNQPVQVLNLSARPANCLNRAGIKSIAELFMLTSADLLDIRSLGVYSLEEIKKQAALFLQLEEQPKED